MPIHLYSGQPGNGKTALMVEHLIEEAGKAERPIVASGIDGLADGLALQLVDPRKWNAIDPDADPICTCSASDRPHGHVIPDGSLIFVDEAWKWFGHLQDASRQKTPDHVLQLAEHRHRGIDFVWTTQMPNQIFPFVRGLGGAHTHVLRRFGTHMIDTFRWEEWVDDVKSITRRENSQKVTRRLPSQVFDKYKSATLHTIKRRIPFKVMVLPLTIIAAIACGWYAFNYFKPDAINKRLTGQAGASGEAAAPPSAEGKQSPSAPLSVEDYTARLTPRIQEAPWTAPLYDERGATADPLVFCAIAQAGENSLGRHTAESCTCMTEQGTPYTMVDDPQRSGDARCRHVARWGHPYNPFKQQQRDESGPGKFDRDPQEQPPAQAETRAAIGSGIAPPDGLPPQYGGFRDAKG
jgi:hypothetical protein